MHRVGVPLSRYGGYVDFPASDQALDSAREGESQTLRAVLQIRELLIQGAFKPGERIREVPLAARLRVSRTPLRIALDRLAHEGLLEARPTVGFVAREFSVADVLDAIELRGVLEGTAARFAAERLQQREEAAGMYQCVEAADRLLRRRMPRVDLIREWVSVNANFHANLLRLAKSSMLTSSLDRVLALPFASQRVCFRRNRVGGTPGSSTDLQLASHGNRRRRCRSGGDPRRSSCARAFSCGAKERHPRAPRAKIGTYPGRVTHSAGGQGRTYQNRSHSWLGESRRGYLD
jgi:DNA-binding GntR family transcriptional regulator